MAGILDALNAIAQGATQFHIQEEKKSQDNFFRDKELRTRILLEKIPQVRQEDQGQYLSSLEEMFKAKNQKSLDQAWGNITGRMAAEDYSAERTRNEYELGRADSQEFSSKQKGIAIQQAKDAQELGLNAPSQQNIEPLEELPPAPWEGKVRLQTQEGKDERAFDLYQKKQEEQIKGRIKVEQVKGEERLKQKRAELLSKGVQNPKPLLDQETGQFIGMTGIDPSTGKPGFWPIDSPSYSTTESGLKTTTTDALQRDKMKQAHQEWEKDYKLKVEKMNKMAAIASEKNKIAREKIGKSGNADYKRELEIIDKERDVQSEYLRAQIASAEKDVARESDFMNGDPARLKVAREKLDTLMSSYEKFQKETSEAVQELGKGMGRVPVSGSKSSSSPSSTPSAIKRNVSTLREKLK